MGLLDALLGRRDDPTKNWSAVDYTVPSIDLESMTFGPLHFGCNLADANYFGKPDKFTWKNSEECELLYARGGFQLDFEASQLAYIAFFIAQDRFLPDHPGMSLSKPDIKGIAQLTKEISIGDLSRLFGSPTSEDRDGQEIILSFSRSGVMLEFELNPSGFLKRLNIFPEQA